MSYAFIAFIERAAIAIVIVFVGLLFGANAAMKGLGIYLLIWGLLFGLNRLLDVRELNWKLERQEEEKNDT